MKKILICIMSLLLISFLSYPICADSEEIDAYSEYYGPGWDINHNGITNGADLSLLVNDYFDSGDNGWIREDINDDGTVDGADLSLMVNHYFEIWTS
jgi:hypothetical protein